MADGPSCSTCRFSDFAVLDTLDQLSGEPGEMPHRICRRFPPTMVGLGDSAGPGWPPVHDGEWCGEFVITTEPTA